MTVSVLQFFIFSTPTGGNNVYDEVTDGGIVCSGETTVNEVYLSIAINGGIVCSGENLTYVFCIHVSDSGTILNGNAIKYIFYIVDIVSSGALLSGIVQEIFYPNNPKNGVLVGGSHETSYSKTISGGITCHYIEIVNNCIYNIVAFGGIKFTKSTKSNLEFLPNISKNINVKYSIGELVFVKNTPNVPRKIKDILITNNKEIIYNIGDRLFVKERELITYEEYLAYIYNYAVKNKLIIQSKKQEIESELENNTNEPDSVMTSTTGKSFVVIKAKNNNHPDYNKLRKKFTKKIDLLRG